MNKRRQIADSNPKNFTHFSGNATGSSDTNSSPTNANNSTPSAPTKSIIIGAGQPIIVPNQRNINADLNAIKSSDSKQATIASDISAAVKAQTIHVTKSSVRSEHSNKVTSVEEFCPDDETLDKSFLDELPSTSSTLGGASHARRVSYDSDSDGNEPTGNPLVAQFHDDPADMIGHRPNVPNEAPKQSATGPMWENPLAKQKANDWALSDLGVAPIRRNSLSSDDVEIPTILKVSNDGHSNDGVSTEDYDSWLSDTNQRRSPEGGEDEATITNLDKDVDISSASIRDISLNDSGGDGGDDGDAKESDRSLEKSSKKKKKKDKKERSDDKEKKKKKRSDKERSKHRSNELLTEQNDDVHSTTEPELYEAI